MTKERNLFYAIHTWLFWYCLQTYARPDMASISNEVRTKSFRVESFSAASISGKQHFLQLKCRKKYFLTDSHFFLKTFFFFLLVVCQVFGRCCCCCLGLSASSSFFLSFFLSQGCQFFFLCCCLSFPSTFTRLGKMKGRKSAELHPPGAGIIKLITAVIFVFL